MNERLLIIDCNSICHIAKHSTRELSFSGVKTGVIFGFFNILLSLSDRFNTSNIIFCWDTQRDKLKRRKLSPEYKLNKKDKAISEETKFLNEVAYPQFNKLKNEVLNYLGFLNVHYATGYEADDIIAYSVIENSHYQSTIVSRDSDLWQLINDNCNFYEPVKKEIIDRGIFLKRHRIDPSIWAAVLSITGCSGDGVSGIGGVGEKKAIKFLNGEVKEGSNLYNKINENWDKIEENLSLVYLPFDNEISGRFKFVKDKVDSERFVEFCNEYGFKSFLTSINRWKRVFRMI